MPYGDGASLIRPYLTPMFGTFIRGKEHADNQDLRERQFGQEVRRYDETSAPYTKELTKQMQFANKKAEEAQRLYQTTMGGSADVSAPAGVTRDEAMRGYLGWNPAAQKIKFNLPEVGEVEGTLDQYISSMRSNKPEEKRYTVNWNGQQIEATPSEISRLFPNREPQRPELMSVWRIGPDGKRYLEVVEKKAGMRFNDAEAAGNRPPSAGGAGDPIKALKLQAMQDYVNGRATPEQIRLIGADKDPNMGHALRAVLSNPAVFGMEPEQVMAVIENTRQGLNARQQQVPSPAAPVDNDPFKIR